MKAITKNIPSRHSVIQIELPIAALQELTHDKGLSVEELHCLNGTSKLLVKRMLLENLRHSLSAP